MSLLVDDFDGFQLEAALSALHGFHRKATQASLFYYHELTWFDLRGGGGPTDYTAPLEEGVSINAVATCRRPFGRGRNSVE